MPHPPVDRVRARPRGRGARGLRLAMRSIRLALEAGEGRPDRIVPAFRRARVLLGEHGFGAREIRRLNLLDAGHDGRAVTALTRAQMCAISEALNPADARGEVGRKDRFAAACARHGLPVPRLLAIHRGTRAGSVRDEATTGARSAGAGDGRSWLDRLGADAFVVKPAVSGYGRDVRVCERVGPSRFRDARGVRLDGDALLAWMDDVGGRHGCVIQERVHNHAAIEQLSGSRYLQTVRFYTLLDRTGTPRLLHAYFKLIAGDNFIDNFRAGDTGNLLALPDLEDGMLGPALAPDRRGRLVEVRRHPDTGARIDGIRLPDWAAARALAFEAARAFAPLRLVGWDVAIGPDGPILIEGNWNSDPPNPGGRMARVIADIRRWA
ncbi:MAG: sugar-transfer associated ATP-grasp domain-containing protein [Myxococcota bacterium]